MFFLSGVPVLYSGDEIAQLNDYSYHDDPLKAEDSRYLHRGDLDWKKAARRKLVKTPEGRIFRAIRKMEEIRALHPAFDDAADTWLVGTDNDRVLGIGRYYQKEQLLGLFNFSDVDETVWLRDPLEYEDLLTGKRQVFWKYTIKAGSYLWLAHKFS